MNFTEILEVVLRCFFALQLLVWGLNGFLHWIPVPKSSGQLEQFVEACIQVRFIMPTVKVAEIIFSIFLLFNIFTFFSLLILAPIIFVITGLHVFWNPRPYAVLLTCSLPYFILLVLYFDKLLQLLHL